jgi:hypothetical protein
MTVAILEHTATLGDDPAPLAARLAALVAHPTAPRPFLIDRDNKNAGWPHDVRDATDSGHAYAVTLAADVVALDLDTAEAAEAGHQFAAELIAEGRPVLRTASGRPDHLHVWTHALDRLDRAHIVELAKAHDLGHTVRNGPMRPPLSPHRLGLAVRALDDAGTFIATVDARRWSLAPRRERATLPDWRELLTSGRWPTGHDALDLTGSAMTFAICRGAIRAGHDRDDVAAWLADPANGGGECYRRRGGDKYLDRVWPGAVKSAGRLLAPPADATEARRILDDLRAVVEAHPWKGRAGTTDRAVMLAILDRAHRRGTLTPAMSHREIAEAVGVTRRTVSTSQARLRQAGRLQVSERGRGRTAIDADGCYREQAHATRWRLPSAESLGALTFTTGGTPPERYPLSGAIVRARSSAEVDVCRHRGLGLNAPRLLDALASGPLRPAELAEALTMHPGSVRRLAGKLAAHGLIVRDAGRWTLADDLEAAMHRAAESLGLDGKAQAVRRAHAAERDRYTDHREETRPARAARRRRAIVTDRGPTLPLVPVCHAETPTPPDPPPEPPPTDERPVYAALAVAGGRGD